MKLKVNASPVEISGNARGPRRFRVAANRETFRILSSGIYTQKIRAIIRELSCNAIDAHVAAGREDVPFTVHLPTYFEPIFSIKDTGTGLAYCEQGCVKCRGEGSVVVKTEKEICAGCSGTGNIPTGESCGGCDALGFNLVNTEEDCEECGGSGDYDAVIDLYTTYFGSDKTNSNDFVGALGLGSKSPLCYEASQGFTLINIFNGMRRIYTCFINEDGMPDVLLQTADPTEEHSGLEVSFPVNSKDVQEFKNQAEEVWEFFVPRPDCNVNVEVDEQQYVIRSEQWGLRKNQYGSNDEVRAIQGRVQYSIGEIDNSRLNATQKSLLDMPLDLFFNIGDLEVAASREALSNSEDTIATLLRKLDEVSAAMLDDIKNQLRAATTPWEAKLKLFSLENTDGIGALVRQARREGKFTDLGTSFGFDPKVEYKILVDQTDYPHIQFARFERSGHSELATKHILNKVIPANTTVSKGLYNIKFEVAGRTVFVVNDVGFGAEKYIHRYLQTTNREKDHPLVVYFLTRAAREIPLEYVKKRAHKLLLSIGKPPLVLLSTLKEKYKDASFPREINPRRDIVKFNASAAKNSRGEGWRGYTWETVDAKALLTATNRKFFLPVKGLIPTVGNFHSASNLSTLVRRLRSLTAFGWVKDTQLYGVRQDRVKHLDASWINLVDYITARYPAVFTRRWERGISLAVNRFDSDMKSFLTWIAKELPLDGSSPLQKFAVKYNLAKNAQIEDAVPWKELAREVERFTPYKLNTSSTDFNDEWKDVRELYPLLKGLDGWWFSSRVLEENFSSLITYIKAVEQERADSVFAVDPNQLSLFGDVNLSMENEHETIN